jgi:hypothetical protein
MTKDEVLALALEALELEDMACRYEKESTPEHIAKAITAIKQALALDKMAENARELGLDYEPCCKDQTCPKCKPAPVQEPVAQCTVDVSGAAGPSCEPLNWHKTAAQPAVPDAMTSADIQEHIEYVAGWNDCRQAMMEMMK